MQRNLKYLKEKNTTETKKRKVHISLIFKKSCFVNKTARTSRAKRTTSNSNSNADITQCSEARNSEEEDI